MKVVITSYQFEKLIRRGKVCGLQLTRLIDKRTAIAAVSGTDLEIVVSSGN